MPLSDGPPLEPRPATVEDAVEAVAARKTLAVLHPGAAPAISGDLDAIKAHRADLDADRVASASSPPPAAGTTTDPASS